MFASLSYAYSILRPIQDEIRRRGDDVAWYLQGVCPDYLRPDEKRLNTIQEVLDYDPIAVFAPGNFIYDFFPGVKVAVFHGLYYKKNDYGDHYKIRGWFDLYCVTSSLFMPRFEELEKEHGFFKVVETGWSKFDEFCPDKIQREPNEHPVVLYAPTFTTKLTSVYELYDEIERLLTRHDWVWYFSFHPKMDKEIIAKYKKLADMYENAIYIETEDKKWLFDKADVMLSDSSSVIYEFLWFGKPAVTYRNTFPDAHLLNTTRPEEIEGAIGKALQRPDELMININNFMDVVHSFRDGKASVRILDAVDDFILNYKGKIKKKPLNFFRKLRFRKKAHYFPFGPRYKKKAK